MKIWGLLDGERCLDGCFDGERREEIESPCLVRADGTAVCLIV